MREAVRSRPGERGRDIRGAVLVCAVLALLASLLLASSASALTQRGHTSTGSFAIEEGNGVQLKEPAGVAVNETTGNIYVVDAGNNRVVEFDAGHHFVSAWGWGVTDGAKSFEVCKSACRAGLPGHSRGQLHGAEDIAVDNSKMESDPSAGFVYVETVLPYEEEVEGHTKEFENTVIEKFGPNGELPAKGGRIKGFKEHGESTELFEEEVHGLTVGSAGTLYVYNEESIIEYTNEAVNKFKGLIASEAEEGRHGIAVDTERHFYVGRESEQAGGVVGAEPASVIGKLFVVEELGSQIGELAILSLTDENSSGVAVDTANNDALVDNETSVALFGAGSEPGEPTERFGEGNIQHGRGLAAPRNGEVLVADAGGNRIDTFGLEPPGAPTIAELSATKITQSSAELHSQIDPRGLASSYVFRYSTGVVPGVGETCAGSCVEVPAPAGEIGAVFSDTPVEAEITGLTPSTVYHYRVIAFNASAPAGVASGEQKFRTELASSAVLPDGRRWELVSPLQKNGAAIEGPPKEGGLIEASEDGERLTYIAIGAFPGAEGNRAPEPTQVFAVRGGSEWSNSDIDPREVTGLGLGPGHPVAYRYFSSDLTSALLQPFGQKQYEAAPLDEERAPGETPKHESTPFVRSTSLGCLASPAPLSCFSPVLTPANVPAEREVEGKQEPNAIGGKVNFLESTPDMKHLVTLASGFAKLGVEPAGKENLYESSEGHNTLVSVLPNGQPSLRAQLGAFNRNTHQAVSADGSRVVWAESDGSSPVHLFLRDVPKGETVQLDVPKAGAETTPPSQRPVFQAASADGSQIFFTDEQRLTTDASPRSASNPKDDLYNCRIVENEAHKLECKLTDLTAPAHAGEASAVLGLIPGTGEDGTKVYFVANGALAAGSTPGDCRELQESRNKGEFRLTATCNLYVESYDAATESWTAPKLIARLSGEDESDWGDATPGSKILIAARVSQDGNSLAFVSDRNLTGFNNVDANSNKPDTEVFLYNATTDHLTCASCNPFGRRPVGVFDTEFAGEGRGRLVDRPLSFAERWMSGSLPAWTHVGLLEAPYPSRYLFNDGRMFFMSAEALVPQDTNGKEDVYEYEPPTVGGCTTESETYSEISGGCVSLISSGTSARESTFLDASASGNDVFFTTSERLAPSDTDTSYDVYDATVCGQPGSHACLPAPVISPPPCTEIEGEHGCRSSSTEPGAQFATPGTATSKGTPNSTGKEVLGTKEEAKLTNAQRLSKALTSCHKISNHGKRQACEKTAILKYGTKAQKLNASLKACKAVKNHGKRHACEKAARKKYGTAKKAAHGARRGR